MEQISLPKSVMHLYRCKFEKALTLNPDSAIAHIEYANGMVMLDGKKKMDEAVALYEEAAAFEARETMERLDVQLAIEELED